MQAHWALLLILGILMFSRRYDIFLIRRLDETMGLSSWWDLLQLRTYSSIMNIKRQVMCFFFWTYRIAYNNTTRSSPKWDCVALLLRVSHPQPAIDSSLVPIYCLVNRDSVILFRAIISQKVGGLGNSTLRSPSADPLATQPTARFNVYRDNWIFLNKTYLRYHITLLAVPTNIGSEPVLPARGSGNA